MLAISSLRLRPALPAALLAAAVLAACSKPAPKTEDVRPVRAIVLAAGDVASGAEFAGEVRPRIESRLGFRVGGKIVARKVDVGATVKRGQVLMQLDPQDLQLGQAQALAQLRAAETSRDLAQADLKRYQELRAQNFVSPAVLEAKQAAFKQAQASVDAANAAHRNLSNQAAYASLASDTDGVVTGIDAEVGQVVAAGTPVLRVARTDEKDVVIAVPEDQVEALRAVRTVSVRLWAAPEQAIEGRIREVAPAADPATRTYTVKIAVPAQPQIRIGMTASARLAGPAGSALRVPLTALVQNRSGAAVWVVDKGAVSLVPVQLGQPSGNDIIVLGGVKPGQTVVTAGVNLLKNGQKVTVLSADVSQRRDAEAQLAGGAAR